MENFLVGNLNNNADSFKKRKQKFQVHLLKAQRKVASLRSSIYSTKSLSKNIHQDKKK